MNSPRSRKWFIKTISFSLDTLSLCPRYAYIYHDKDTTTFHYHICVEFANAKTLTAVINSLLLDKNSTCEIWNNDGALLYLTHKNQKNKYQYSPQLVITKNINYIDIYNSALNDKDITLCDIWYFLNKPSKIKSQRLNKMSLDKNLSRKMTIVRESKFLPPCQLALRYFKLSKNVDNAREIFINTFQSIQSLPINDDTKQNLYDSLIYDSKILFAYLKKISK